MRHPSAETTVTGVDAPRSADSAVAAERPGDDVSRRRFLEFLSQAAVALSAATIVPLATGCGEDYAPEPSSSKTTRRRHDREPIEVDGFGDSPDEIIRRYEAKYPGSKTNTAELLKRREEERNGGDDDGEEDADHGNVKCWKQAIGSPWEWVKSHWETVFFTTGGGVTHLIPGDTWVENVLGRLFPAIFTVGNGAFRGILAPETLYSLFMLFIDKWIPWGSTFVNSRRASGGGGGGTTTP